MADNYTINFSDPVKASFLIKSYTSDGPVFPTFRDAGFVDPVLAATSIAASTSLLLYGRALPDYGERIGENFVHLLENFSGPGQPINPIAGQLWHRVRNYFQDNTGGSELWYEWDGAAWILATIDPGGPVSVPVGGDGTLTTLDGTVANARLFRYTVLDTGEGAGSSSWVELASTNDNVDPTVASPPVEPDAELLLWDGTAWTEVTPTGFSITAGPTAPAGAGLADLWYDTDTSSPDPWSLNSQLKIHDGSGFVSVAENYLLNQPEGDSLKGILTVGSPALMNIGDITPTNRTDVVPYGVILDLDSDDIAAAAGVVVAGTNVTDVLNNKINNIANFLGPTPVGTSPARSYADKVLGSLLLSSNTGAASTVDILLRNLTEDGPRDFTVAGTDSSVAVNKNYVDIAVAAGAGTDTFIDTATFNAVDDTGSPPAFLANTLVLEYVGGVPTALVAFGIAAANHSHAAAEITNSPSGNVVSTDVQSAIVELDAKKAPIDTPDFIGNVSVSSGTITLGLEPTDPSHTTTKRYVDEVAGSIRRVIFDAAGSPAVGPYTVPLYVVSRNQTFVTVAGLKQYGTVRGYQEVDLASASGDPQLYHFVVLTDSVQDEITVSGDFTSLYIAGVGFELEDTASAINDGTYEVLSNSSLTSEVTVVLTIADVGSPGLDGTYFTLSTPSEEYYVWMNVDAGGNDPAPGVGTAVPVALTSGDSASAVAIAIDTALSLAGSPDDFTVDVLVGSPGPGVRITANDPGVVLASTADGDIPNDTGFDITQEIGGGNTLIPVVQSVTATEIDGRTSPSYGATITVDGIPYDITVPGSQAQTYTLLVEAIITAMSVAGASAFAQLNSKDAAIRITSNTYPSGSPTGSSVNIVDAVFGGSPLSELPLFSSLFDFIAIDAAVGAKNYNYQEVGFVGDDSTQILFEADPGAGIIEVLIY